MSPNGFEPTQPQAEQQQLQRRWSMRHHVPNHVPVGQRFLNAVVALTWTGWALIGVLSGHMYFLVSKRGPIHFSGVPALIFCAAVLAAATALMVTIVDHYDRRDNEEAYLRVRRWLWYGAGALLVASLFGGCAGIPLKGEAVALVTPQRLLWLSKVEWIARILNPLKDTLERWTLLSFIWLMAVGLFMRLIGVGKKGEQPSAGLGLFLMVFVFLPVLSTFSLALLRRVVNGEFGKEVAGDALGASIAWSYSMLLACGGAWLLVALALIGFGCRLLGIRVFEQPVAAAQSPDRRE